MKKPNHDFKPDVNNSFSKQTTINLHYHFIKTYWSIIALSFLCLLLNAKCFASESSPLYHLDNNWGLTAGQAKSSQYSMMNLGLDVRVLTSNNIWLDLNGQSYSNLTLSQVNSNILNNMSGFGLGVKGGYAFILANNYAIIPNIGFNYSNVQDLVHTNSEPIFNYTLQSFNTSVGLAFEYAATSRLKFSLENSLVYLNQDPIVPNSETTISHFNEKNYMLSITPSIAWNIFASLNASIFYEYNQMLTNNMPDSNVEFTQFGINSQSIVNDFMAPPNVLGIKIGMLF